MSLTCAILIFLYAAVRGKTTEKITHRKRQRYFLALVACSFIMSLADMLSRLDGRPGICVPICRAGNFVLFFFGPLQVILWFLYLGEQIGIRAGKGKRIGYTLYALGAMECVLVLISQKTSWLYYFDSGGVYHRGPFFTLSCVIVMFMGRAANGTASFPVTEARARAEARVSAKPVPKGTPAT